MKKLIFLLLIATFSVVVYSVSRVSFPPMTVGATYQEVLTDYTLTNTISRSFLFAAPQAYPCTQDFVINLDSLTGNHTNVAVSVWGQKSALKNDSTQIGSTVNWKGLIGANPDTTIVISNATANRYRNYIVHFLGTGTGTTRIDVQALKLYLGQ